MYGWREQSWQGSLLAFVPITSKELIGNEKRESSLGEQSLNDRVHDSWNEKEEE